MTEKPLEPGLTTKNYAIGNDPIDSYRMSHVNFHEYNQKNAWIFERINSVVEQINNNFYNFDLNGYDFVQYGEYRDTDNGHYNWHLDSYLGQLPDDEFEQRKLSLTLLLNDPQKDFTGGEFQFNYSEENNPVTVDLNKGTIIIFPSFLIHRVTRVTKGTRKSLVAWIVGPNFR